jgi:hypothetical protein
MPTRWHLANQLARTVELWRFDDVGDSEFPFPIRSSRRFVSRRIFGRPSASKSQNGNLQGSCHKGKLNGRRHPVSVSQIKK